MQHDIDSNALTWLLTMLNVAQLGSSIPSAIHNATTVDLLCKLLSKEDYVSIAGQLEHASDAKNLLDLMLRSLHERYLSSPDATIDVNQRARRLMIKIISKMPVMPNSLFVTGVIMPAHREYIGGGGFGHILKGELRGKAVALKVLYKTDHDVAFCREALMWRSLDHNLVLPFLGIHEDESASQFFLVSPYMKNGTLAQWRKKANPSVVHIEERILELAHGIEYIHSEGIVHGDLRGANILLDDELHVQIADFGLTRLSEATNTQSGALHLNFAAPELFGFSENDDDSSSDTPPRTQMSDVYAFGCVYYEIHFDSIPFVGKQDTQIWALIFRGILPPRLNEPPLSDGAWDMIQRCWIRKPSERLRIKGVVQRMMALYQSAFTPTNVRNPFYYEMLRKLSLLPLTSSTTEPTSNAIEPPSPVMSTPLKVRKRGRKLARERATAPVDRKLERERGHERKAKGARWRNGEDMMVSPASVSGPPPSQAVVAAFPENLDIHMTPPEYKREGSDWYAIFNPEVKRVLDVQLVYNLMHDSIVCCVSFSSDGKYLATGCNRTAQIYDTKTGAKTCVLAGESAGKAGDLYIRSIRFSPDGKLLATGAEDKQIRIWDIAKKRILHVFNGHQQEINSLDFSLDGCLIVSGSADETVRIWDIANAEAPPKVLIVNDFDPLNIDAGITDLAISPNGQFVAAGSLDNVIRIWDVATGVLVERLRGHIDSVYSIAFTPDGKGLVSGSLDNTLKLWDVSGLSVSNAKMSAGKRAIMEDGENSGPWTTNFIGYMDCVFSVAVSHDGQWIASGSSDGGVRFWDARSAAVQCVLQLRGHMNWITSIDLSPMGGLLATGNGDCGARIWSYGPFFGSDPAIQNFMTGSQPQ
ncbi:WD40-repeat-containing domain protein [Amanita rubescens]|nr:WD40-repeat-containing domain protein [Amanita rubescens]